MTGSHFLKKMNRISHFEKETDSKIMSFDLERETNRILSFKMKMKFLIVLIIYKFLMTSGISMRI